MSKFIDETVQFTFLTVNGVSIESSFTLDVSIIVADKFTATVHEKKFPIMIRSPKNANYLIDYDLLEAPVQSRVSEEIIQKYQFVNPFALPGCNFEV